MGYNYVYASGLGEDPVTDTLEHITALLWSHQTIF